VFTSKGATMKKILFLLIIPAFLFSCSVFASVTTSDGSITLDLYEDTELGVNNLWVLEMTINEVDAIESLSFHLDYLNVYMDIDNEYNVLNTQYYSIGHNSTVSLPMVEYPVIRTNDPIPVGTTFVFYLLPDTYYLPDYNDTYEPVIDYIPIRINIGSDSEMLGLLGPNYFVASVPEPISMGLFVFGAIFLKSFIKKKYL